MDTCILTYLDVSQTYLTCSLLHLDILHVFYTYDVSHNLIRVVYTLHILQDSAISIKMQSYCTRDAPPPGRRGRAVKRIVKSSP